MVNKEEESRAVDISTIYKDNSSQIMCLCCPRCHANGQTESFHVRHFKMFY